MDPMQVPEDYADKLMQGVFNSAKLLRSLPNNQDEIQYLIRVQKDLKERYDRIPKQLLDIIQIILNTQSTPPQVNTLTDPEEVAEKYDDVSEMTDYMIEEMDSSGVKNDTEKNNPIVKSVKYQERVYHTFKASPGSMERPQLKFEQIDNTPSPFVPKLKTKPNALKPLEEVFNRRSEVSDNIRQHIDSLGLDAASVIGWPHPYEYEIDKFEYLQKQLTKRQEILFSDIKICPFSYITTPNDVKLLVQKLSKVEEFAVDLENHSYHSYLGFVCLMQISTRTEDFIVDTIELRQELHLLNEVFTNPKIVKVLHGSDSDIIWLQRDFGIYVVNMFDTGQASRVLEYPKFSLAYLLEHFCSVTTNKQFQLADWRVRPLPAELLHYARTDTHYLLYIYDRLHNELIEKGHRSNNLLLAVLNRSRELCKKKFEKDTVAAMKDAMFSKLAQPFSVIQMRVLDALFEWRDGIARSEDESSAYILPNYMMVKIAEVMPEDKTQLFRICSPTPTPTVNANFENILRIVQDAKSEQPKPTEMKPNLNTMSSPAVLHSPVAKGPQSVFLPSGNIGGFGFSYNREEPDRNSPDISQDQLFEQADWLTVAPSENKKRSAELDFANNNFSLSSSSSSSLFTYNEPQMDKQKIEKIHSNITSNTPLFSPFSSSSLFQFPFPPFNIPESLQSKPSSSSREPTAPSSSSTTTTEPTSEKPKPADLAIKQELVPKSMEEIYQLSNQNRKRNKEKKKLKDIPLNSSEADAGDDAEERDTEEEEESVDTEDTHEFMKKIGWLTTSPEKNRPKPTTKDDSVISTSSSSSSNSGNNSHNKEHFAKNKRYQKTQSKTYPMAKSANNKNNNNNNNTTFTPYDYNKSDSRVNSDDTRNPQNTSRNAYHTVSMPNMGRGGGGNRNNRGGKGRSQIFKPANK